MKKFSRIHLLILLGAAWLFCGGINLGAQTDMHLTSAYSFMQIGAVDSAKKQIDLCLKDPANANDPQAWYLYGFVYNELYKKYENTDVNSAYRKQAFDALKKSLSLSKDSALNQGTLVKVRYIAGRYYNDAVATLDTVHFKSSIDCYSHYREAALLADPKMDIKKKDVEFYLALSSTYNSLYNNNKKTNIAYFDSTKNTYMQVLKWDPENYTANYNLGLLFWNKGVDLMYAVDFGDSLADVFNVQDHSVELFKESLPFAEKAFEIEPKREETLIVLSGIYYSLMEYQKSKSYQDMLDQLRKPK